MKKFIPILLIIFSILFVTLYFSKGNIDRFKDFLAEENIEFKEVSINENSTFDTRILGKRPHHLQITSDDFLHIYKYPSNALAQLARDNFIKKTEMFDMTAHNLYIAEDMFIIYEYDGVLSDIEKFLDEKIEEYEE
ncbi:hypothetical protein ACFVAD_22745 [Sutcliffiella sp. NPDC057660]|uniref:hypothetical protein n=1 Tax=Sutcliffiella sp. NPDC057660 TaxID=3346199 RepID=UPI0036990D22